VEGLEFFYIHPQMPLFRKTTLPARASYKGSEALYVWGSKNSSQSMFCDSRGITALIKGILYTSSPPSCKNPPLV